MSDFDKKAKWIVAVTFLGIAVGKIVNILYPHNWLVGLFAGLVVGWITYNPIGYLKRIFLAIKQKTMSIRTGRFWAFTLYRAIPSVIMFASIWYLIITFLVLYLDEMGLSWLLMGSGIKIMLLRAVEIGLILAVIKSLLWHSCESEYKGTTAKFVLKEFFQLLLADGVMGFVGDLLAIIRMIIAFAKSILKLLGYLAEQIATHERITISIGIIVGMYLGHIYPMQNQIFSIFIYGVVGSVVAGLLYLICDMVYTASNKAVETT